MTHLTTVAGMTEIEILESILDPVNKEIELYLVAHPPLPRDQRMVMGERWPSKRAETRH